MVRIPDRPDAYIATGGHMRPVAGAGAGLARDLDRVGDAIFRAGLEIRDRNDHNRLVEAQNAYSKAMNSWRTEAESSRQGGAASGFTQDFMARHEELTAEIGEQMRDRGLSTVGEQAFAAWAMDRKSAGVAASAQYEDKQMRLHGQDMHQLRLQDIMRDLENNPAAFADAFGQLEESFVMAVGQGVYRAGEARVRFNEAKDKLKYQAFENLYAQNRGAAMKAMDALGFSVSDKARARKKLEADARADAAQARAMNADKVQALNMQAEDIDYLAAQSGDVKGLRELANSYAALGEDKTAAKFYRRADIYENNAGAIKESRALPLPELAASIESLGGKLESALASGDAHGHRQLTEELKLRAGVFEERRKALVNDPAAAVAAEALEALPEEMRDNPQALTDMRLSAQANNGLPPAMRKILGKEEAAQLKNVWDNGSLEERLGLAAHFDAYGPHAGNVAAEVGLSPSEQLVMLAARRDPGARSNLAAVIAARSAKQDELPKLERGAALASEAADASEAIKAARAAAAALPGIAAFQKTVRDYEDTLERLVRIKGGQVDAARATLDGSFKSLADDKNFALLYDPAKVAQHDLEAGLRNAQNGPALEALAAARSFESDFDRADWLDYMRRQGLWLNAPDADGYVLFDPVAQAPAMDGQGKMLRMRDKDLLGAERRTDRSWQRSQEKTE